MGRILVQNRRPVVPDSATNIITDAAIVAWNGFPEADTQSMVLGGWVKKAPYFGSYDCIMKGSYLNSGAFITVRSDPSGRAYPLLNKSGVATNTGTVINHDKLRWFHVVAIISKTNVTLYKNGILVSTASLIAGFNNGECWQGTAYDFMAVCSNAGRSCSAIFASTNDPNKVLITPEQIRAMYETGAIPKDIIYWPMDEGTGSGAGTCKAYVNGVNVPALDGSLSANSWVADSPFN